MNYLNKSNTSNLKTVIYYYLYFHHLLGIISLPCIASFLISILITLINGLNSTLTLTLIISLFVIGLTIITGLDLHNKYHKLEQLENKELPNEAEIIDIPEDEDKIKDINLELIRLLSNPKLDKPIKKQVINESYNRKQYYNIYDEPYLTKTR